MKTGLAMTLMLMVLAGCREIKTSAHLQRGPTFSLDGSGQLASFRIYGPLPGHRVATPFDAKSLIWDVQPSDGYFKGAKVERLVVEYGKMPKGYMQIVPRTGSALVLASHLVYYYFAETTNAPPADGFFYLDEMCPLRLSVQDFARADLSEM
jgi:hypothetical protein